MNILYPLIIAALAGWLAGKIIKGGGFGNLVNIILGIVGGVVGNWVFKTLALSINSEVIGDLVTGLIGALVILFIAGLFKK
ncbi:GlsB/YeaQ/YmgE family stress response membrane protein [Croceitalea sp. P059]|uniref:GlsB/YeaQ/YmgE family stress response membrane protein n=1 Tax=Croceitalea sp. P059 TaxID=3075601 RepID=UPI002884AB15|nr:GlsB/YeaQ/YmgE family stress response membrane protein [Croceitalea sp. P059]MDT0538774.1 GlsB/YeaQ/YmgE family stress response membrane protein [Croceitalea sp. P059]